LRNSKYFTTPVFSLTHANTYCPVGWTAGAWAVWVAASADPTPTLVTAIAVTARIIRILGCVRTSRSGMIILPARFTVRFRSLQRCCVLRVHSPCTLAPGLGELVLDRSGIQQLADVVGLGHAHPGVGVVS
jgi:hypothetical protein